MAELNLDINDEEAGGSISRTISTFFLNFENYQG